jgi:hypothetical protein
MLAVQAPGPNFQPCPRPLYHHVCVQVYAQVPTSPPPGEQSAVNIAVVKPASRSVEADSGLTVDRSRLRKAHAAGVS